jgi:hypothetical protein
MRSDSSAAGDADFREARLRCKRFSLSASTFFHSSRRAFTRRLHQPKPGAARAQVKALRERERGVLCRGMPPQRKQRCSRIRRLLIAGGGRLRQTRRRKIKQLQMGRLMRRTARSCRQSLLLEDCCLLLASSRGGAVANPRRAPWRRRALDNPRRFAGSRSGTSRTAPLALFRQPFRDPRIPHRCDGCR